MQVGVRGGVWVAAERPDVSVLVRALVGPFVERLRLGEGLLLFAAASIVWVRVPSLGSALGRVLVAGVVLALLYAWNDVADAASDRRNPKKNPRLVGDLLAHATSVRRVVACVSVAAIAAAASLGGVWAGAAAIAAFGLNVAYSRRLKGVPVADVVSVGGIGAAYLGVVDAPLAACLVVGLMTAVSHVFQALVDRPVDLAGACRTSAVWSARGAIGLLAAACVTLGIVAAPALGLAAASAVVPLVLHRVAGEPRRAWLLSKAYLGALWLALLGLARLAG